MPTETATLPDEKEAIVASSTDNTITGEETPATDAASDKALVDAMTAVLSPPSPEGDAKAETPEDKGEESGTEEATTEEQDSAKEDEKAPIPYSRFEEVNLKAQELEGKVKEWEPLATAQQQIIDHCRHFGITGETFGYWLDVAALAQSDPAKAVEALKPLLDKVNASNTLSEDLNKRVESGELSVEAAKEIHQLRHGQKLAAEARERANRLAAQRAQDEQTKQTIQVMQTWLAQKQAVDKSFKQKAAGEKDGKFELWLNNFRAAFGATQNGHPLSAKEIEAICEGSLDTINRLSAASRSVAPMKTIKSSSSTSTGKTAPSTIMEFAAQEIKKRGIKL